MARDFKNDDDTGDLETFLDGPQCGWSGTVYYRTQPPTYCSSACRQAAYRERRKRNKAGVTHLVNDWRRRGLADQVGALERIAGRWGPEAAMAAADLADQVAKQVRLPGVPGGQRGGDV